MNYLFATLKISLTSIRANKIRATLTTLGIIIGISAVIAMVSLGQGAQNVILEQVQGLGSNTITIFPVGNFRGFQSQTAIRQLASSSLDRQILKVLENKVQFNEIIAISPRITSNNEVSYGGFTQTTSIYGVTDKFYVTTDRKLTKGRGISASDDSGIRHVATLGSRIAEKLFKASDPLNKSIKIGNQRYQVVGIHESAGSNADDIVFIPLSTAAFDLVGQRDFSQIDVKVVSDEVVDSAATKIEQALLKYNRITDPAKANFTVFTSKDILSLTESITSIFTALLASIASISLVVGGIGIMNIMLVSVTERTKEIGLRKAVGAKQSAILFQFLLEAVVLTMVGGIIGIILGAFFGFLIGKVGNIPTEISPQAIFLATSVSVGIGLVFGFYPAYSASKLNPIDALRYE